MRSSRSLAMTRSTVSADLLHVGFGNVVAIKRVIALTGPDSAPIKRMVREARERGTLVDLTCGRKTKAVLVLDSGHVVLAAVQPDTIASRLSGNGEVGDAARA